MDSIINKASDLAVKELGLEVVANLVKNVAKRLLRRSLAIIKEEIQILTSKQTIKTLIGVLKDAAMLTLKSGLKGRKIKDILMELLSHAEQHPEFKKIIRDMKQRLAEKFLAMAKEEAKRLAGEAIDAFIRVYGGWSGSLLDISRKEVSVGPWWGCVYADLSASAKIVGSLTTKREGIGARGVGQVSGNAFVGLGLRIGYDLPIVGDISITGGVEGGPSLSASLQVAFRMKSSLIEASVAPFTIDAAFKARLFLETPIPNNILKYVPAYVNKATVSKQNIYYPLGKVNLIVMTTPTYSMNFSMKTGKFRYVGASGDYHIEMHPAVKATIKQIKESIEKAADEAMSYLDPTSYDLNPFDSEGWIGRYF